MNLRIITAAAAVCFSILASYKATAQDQSLPFCSDLTESEEVFSAAIEQHLESYSDIWGEDYEPYFADVANTLGCQWKPWGDFFTEYSFIFSAGFEAESLISASGLSNFFDAQQKVFSCDCANTAQTEYCPCIQYCGPGDSLDNSSLLIPNPNPSQELNQRCFEHDRCYGRQCLRWDTKSYCVFNTGHSETVRCDAPLLEFCAGTSFNGSVAMKNQDWHLCKLVRFLSVDKTAECLTPDSPNYCPEGQQCIVDLEQCGEPLTFSAPQQCYVSERDIDQKIFSSYKCSAYFSDSESCLKWVEPRVLPGNPYDHPAGSIDCTGACVDINEEQRDDYLELHADEPSC